MIRTRGLRFAYDGAVALDGVDCVVEDGEFALVVGPNGSGKSTLVRQFNGLLEPDDGEVLVNGRPVADDLVAARRAVGMVFQTPRDGFVAATVEADVAFGPENLGLDRDEIGRRVETALDAVGMADRREARLDRLSGGEQARVAIAGALAMGPDHLVLDEPLGSLDRQARERVLGHLDDLHADGTSVVLVTHDPEPLLDRADRVLALRDGRVACSGPPAEVRAALDALGTD